jgi:hypothetical protein
MKKVISNLRRMKGSGFVNKCESLCCYFFAFGTRFIIALSFDKLFIMYNLTKIMCLQQQ